MATDQLIVFCVATCLMGAWCLMKRALDTWVFTGLDE